MNSSDNNSNISKSNSSLTNLTNIPEHSQCLYDSQCANYPYYLCKSSICEHKNLTPFYPKEIGGIIVLIFFMAISNVSGIGGGGVIISLIMYFYSFNTKYATSVSSFAILSSSLARFILQIKDKHPEKDAIIIDYGLSTIMMPTVLIGSFIGAFINVTFPGVVITIILTLVLFVLGGYSIYKAKQVFVKENEMLK